MRVDLKANSKIYSHDKIIYFEITENILLPYQSCKIKLGINSNNVNYITEEIDVYKDDKLIFSGIVDNQKISVSKSFLLLEISSRSKKGALIYDNKAKPASYVNVTMQQLITKHLAPYGVTKMNATDDRMLPLYTVGLNQSNWDVVNKFCKHLYNRKPYISSDTLVVKKRAEVNASKTFYISNLEKSIAGKNFLQYSSMDFEVNTKEAFSEIIVIDENGIESSVKNASSKRDNKKYISGSSSWTVIPRWAARNELDENILKSNILKIEIPQFLDISLGDKIVLSDFNMGKSDFEVNEIRKEISGEIKTSLILN